MGCFELRAERAGLAGDEQAQLVDVRVDLMVQRRDLGLG